MGRILAIDYGKVRTGLAVTDDLKIIASGLTTVQSDELIEFLKDYISNQEIELFVIGLPKQLNNELSEIECLIETFIKELNETFKNIPIKRIDERFTSKLAFQSMIDGGLKKKSRRNKALIDEISATILLQDYLSSIN
jgi:putative Holliday junction resolvase